MKSIKSLASCLAILAVSATPVLYAQTTAPEQTTTPAQTTNPDQSNGQPFNPQTIETIQGQVLGVQPTTSATATNASTQLLVQTERGTIPVQLGPSWFLQKQQLEIKPQDQIKVTGSRVTRFGKEALIAQEISIGDKNIKLRDQTGHPLWAGGPQNPATGQMGQNASGVNQPTGRQQWTPAQNKMFAQMKSMDAELDKKVEQMNQAQGPDKVESMADLLNLLVKQRETMHQQMAQMHQHMMSTMPMGHPGSGMGAPGTQNETETGQQPANTPPPTPPAPPEQ